MSDIDVTRRNKKPRLLTPAEKEKLEEFIEMIHYSARYAPAIPTFPPGADACPPTLRPAATRRMY